MITKIFDCVASTNDELKKLKEPLEDTLYFAREQSGGRGSKGRAFECKKGGVYLSLLRLNPCKASESFNLMISAALAVVNTLDSIGVRAEIKWPNDIFVKGKKICGILIENVFEGDMVARSIIGIGLNVNNKLSEELSETAVTVEQIIGHRANIDYITKNIVDELYKPHTIEEYKAVSGVIGKRITVIKGNETYEATAEDVLPDGNLLLESGERLSAAEITIR